MDARGNGGTPAAPAPPPPPPGEPEWERPHSAMWRAVAIGLIAVLIAVAIATGAGYFLFVRPGSGEPEAQDTATGAANLSGTAQFPGRCSEAVVRLVATSDAGADLGGGAINLRQNGQDCTGSFSFPLRPAPTYLISLQEEAPGTRPFVLKGPRYTREQLQAEGWRLALTLDDFGIDEDDVRAQALLDSSLDGARTYFRQQDSFAGMDPASLGRIVSDFPFNTADEAVRGEVTVRNVTPTTVVFTTRSASGTFFCEGLSSKTPNVFAVGQIDARTYKECLEWYPPGQSPPPPGVGGGSPNPPIQI